MKLSILVNGKKELDSFQLFGSNGMGLDKNPLKKTGKSNLVLNEYYLCYSTPLFGIVYFNFSKMTAKEILCEFEGDSIFLSFQRNGRTLCTKKNISGSMEAKQNNIFFNSGHLSCQMNKSDCFRVILSKKYVEELSALYPEALIPIANAFRKQQNSIFDHSHLDTTLEMEQIIQDIELLHLLNNGKNLFIEAKIRELLYRQILQHSKILNKKDSNIEKYRSHMQMACTYIESNIKELPTLSEIASAVGVCDSILKIAFKHCYGKTVNEYYNEYRLNKSRKYLQNPYNNIADVAYLTGYKYTSYFSTAFKQKYGITPKEYQKKVYNALLEFESG